VKYTIWLSIRAFSRVFQSCSLVPRFPVPRFHSPYRCGIVISICKQPPRLTQPGHPFVCKHSEHQPNGGDALQLGSEGKYGICVCVTDWQVKLCDPFVTQGRCVRGVAQSRNTDRLCFRELRRKQRRVSLQPASEAASSSSPLFSSSLDAPS